MKIKGLSTTVIFEASAVNRTKSWPVTLLPLKTLSL